MYMPVLAAVCTWEVVDLLVRQHTKQRLRENGIVSPPYIPVDCLRIRLNLPLQ